MTQEQKKTINCGCCGFTYVPDERGNCSYCGSERDKSLANVDREQLVDLYIKQLADKMRVK